MVLLPYLSLYGSAFSTRLEVVSKPQIRFKGPAKRDYISDLNKLRYASRRRPIEKVVVLSIHLGM